MYKTFLWVESIQIESIWRKILIVWGNMHCLIFFMQFLQKKLPRRLRWVHSQELESLKQGYVDQFSRNVLNDKHWGTFKKVFLIKESKGKYWRLHWELLCLFASNVIRKIVESPHHKGANHKFYNNCIVSK